MNTVSQIIRYVLSIVLMIPMLGFALIVSPLSKNLGWRIVRSWNNIALKIFGIHLVVEFENGESRLEEGGVIGSRRCLPVGEWRIRPGNIVLRYLKPISTKGLTYEDRNVLLEKLRAVGEAEHGRWKKVTESAT